MSRIAWHLALAVALSVAASLASACSSSSKSGSQGTTSAAEATTPSKLTGLQEYQSVQELADGLTKHCHPCVDLTPDKPAYQPVETADARSTGR